MKIYFYFLLFITFISNRCLENKPLTSQNIITLQIKEYPSGKAYPPINCNLLKNHLKDICLKIDISQTLGIVAFYAGYRAMSDYNGDLTFPRKVINDSINILITNKIKPIFMFQSTIAFWEIVNPEESKMYNFSRKKDDATKLYFWNVIEKDLPKNNRIPVQTMIIFANPKDFYVPLGVSMAKHSPNLILPPIYVIPEVNNIQDLLFILNIKPFFSKIPINYKEIPLGYQSLILT